MSGRAQGCGRNDARAIIIEARDQIFSIIMTTHVNRDVQMQPLGWNLTPLSMYGCAPPDLDTASGPAGALTGDALAAGTAPLESAALMHWTVRTSNSRSKLLLIDLECRITPRDCCDPDEWLLGGDSRGADDADAAAPRFSRKEKGRRGVSF